MLLPPLLDELSLLVLHLPFQFQLMQPVALGLQPALGACKEPEAPIFIVFVVTVAFVLVVQPWLEWLESLEPLIRRLPSLSLLLSLSSPTTPTHLSYPRLPYLVASASLVGSAASMSRSTIPCMGSTEIMTDGGGGNGGRHLSIVSSF